MAETQYYGDYVRFDTASKADAAQLISADNLVGDRYEIVFLNNEGKRIAWLKNRFDKLVGFLDEKTTHDLSFCEARGFTIQAFLSFVAFTDNPKPGKYWGEVALICYSPQEETLRVFTEALEKQFIDGKRPKIDLGNQGVKQVIEGSGLWLPNKSMPLPKFDGKTAFVKTKRSTTEKLVEKGRTGNKGCTVAGWIFCALLVVAAIFGLRACGIF